MIGLLFHYQDFAQAQEGQYTFMHSINMEMWRQTAKALGATHFIAVPVTPVIYEHADADILYERHATLQEAVAAHPGAALVYLEDERVIPGSPVYRGSPDDPPVPYEYLTSFVHPPGDVLYIVGPDYLGLDPRTFDLTGGNKLVTIPTAQSWSLWAIVAAAIALHDRQVKGG